MKILKNKINQRQYIYLSALTVILSAYLLRFGTLLIHNLQIKAYLSGITFETVIFLICVIGSLVFSFYLSLMRINDTKLPKWLLLLLFIPYIGMIFSSILFFIPSAYKTPNYNLKSFVILYSLIILLINILLFGFNAITASSIFLIFIFLLILFVLDVCVTKIINFIKFLYSKYENKQEFKYPNDYLIQIINDYENKFCCFIFRDIAEKFKNIVKNNPDNINSNISYYNEDKSINIKAVEHIAVQFLCKYIDSKLTSGELHIYRGVLNTEGKELLCIYKKIIKELIRLEIKDEDTQKPIDEAWINRNINSLLEYIKAAG